MKNSIAFESYEEMTMPSLTNKRYKQKDCIKMYQDTALLQLDTNLYFMFGKINEHNLFLPMKQI